MNLANAPAVRKSAGYFRSCGHAVFAYARACSLTVGTIVAHARMRTRVRVARVGGRSVVWLGVIVASYTVLTHVPR